jgi:hypothetical protein
MLERSLNMKERDDVKNQGIDRRVMSKFGILEMAVVYKWA